jgi:7-cyano-7-deazaguanine synthase
MKGSFSAAILKSSEFGSTSLSLIKNYLPLHVMIDYENNMIWFANVKEALNEVPSAATTIIDFPPYTTIDLDVSGTFVAACKQLKYLDNLKGNLYHGVQKERAIVVCSSGLDSTTVASLAVNKYGKDNVLLLHYHYGCKAEDRESQRIVKIAEHLGTQYKFVDISTVFANMKSPILGKTGHITDGDTGIEFAHEWVPCRNLIMMSIAMGIAESEGYSTIQLGANLTEQASFPDNSLDFIEKLNALAPYSVQNNAKIRVEAPLVNLMKQEIVKLGSSIGTPYDLTWSCYHDGEKHCGTCAPCTMRKIAFEMNGLKDPVM